MSEEDLSTQQSTPGEAPRVPAPYVYPGRTIDPEGPPPQGSASPVSLIWRVDRRETFEALRRARRRRDGPITVSWVAGDPSEPPRVAYTVGRKVGTAVVRNQVKRRIRTIVREAAPRLRPGAYLIGVSPVTASTPYSDLRVHVLKALEKLENQ